MPEMEKSAPVGVVGRLLRLKPQAAAGAGLHAPRLMPSSSEVNDDKLPFLLHAGAGNFSQGPSIQPTTGTGQVTPRGRGWERYLGMPIGQTNGSCALVASIVCLEAVHRFVHETVHGEGTFFIPRTRWADEPLWKLFDECRADRTWVEKKGANIGRVLEKIKTMCRRVEAANAPPCCRILPLRDYRIHSWDDYFGTGLSPGRVAVLLDTHGPCVGRLWVEPPYYNFDAGRDDAAVYRGCGRSKDYRDQSKRIYRDEAEWHAVVCFAYRVRGAEMHVLVMDNHDDATGPLRWIAVEAFQELYTLTVL